MKAKGSIKVLAVQLKEALKVVLPSRPKKKDSYPLTLTLDRKRKTLEIAEAHYALRGYEITASGKWPKLVQVEGVPFRKLIQTYPDDELIELVATDDELCILAGRSTVLLKRLDGLDAKPIRRRAIPKDPRHNGTVEIPRDPDFKRREEHDTWGLSAHVPMPPDPDREGSL